MAPDTKPLVDAAATTPIDSVIPPKLTKAEIAEFGKDLYTPIELDLNSTRDEMCATLLVHIVNIGGRIQYDNDGVMECVPAPEPPMTITPVGEAVWTLPEDVAAYSEALDKIEAPFPRQFTLNGMTYRQETAEDALEPVAIAMESEESEEPESSDPANWIPLVRINIPGMKGSGLRALEGMVRGTFGSKAGYSIIGGEGTWEIRGAFDRSEECEKDAITLLRDNYGFVVNPEQFVKRLAPTVAELEAAHKAEEDERLRLAAEHATTGE